MVAKGVDDATVDLEAPLVRARKALVAHADARRWRAESAAQRQRDYLGELARPGGLLAATRAIEDSLQGLMDVCGGIMEGQRVYTVEVFADAPMRVRASFEDRVDAEEYAKRFGGTSACLISESVGLIGRDAEDAAHSEDDHDDAICALQRELEEKTLERDSLQDERDKLDSECDELRAELQERDEEIARLRKETA